MTAEAERAYVRQWAETGRLLEELRLLGDAEARRALLTLIDAALRVPLPRRRREWSGLVDQQDRLHDHRVGERR